MAEHGRIRRESLDVEFGEGRHPRVRMRPDVVFGNLQRSLQRTLDLAALALQAPREKLGRLPELGTFPRIQFGSRLKVTELPRHYRGWIMGHAITDVVEALEPLLTDTARICRLALLMRREPVERREVEGVLEAEDLETLGQKLARVSTEFPDLVPEDLRAALSPLNKLRVCLTHAAGRVRERDCNVAGSLEVSRVFWEFWVEYESGEAERAVPRMMPKEPGWLVMRRSRTPRRFELGEQIDLGLEDLVTIANTVFELSLSLRKNLYSLLRDLGRFPKDFKEPDLRRTVGAVLAKTGKVGLADSVVRSGLRRLAALGQLIWVRISRIFLVFRRTGRKATEGSNPHSSSRSGQTR